MRNGVVLGEKRFINDMVLYVPPLWAPSRLIMSRSPVHFKVSGPRHKVLEFARKEVLILIEQLLNQYVGLWWNHAQLRVDGDYMTKHELMGTWAILFRQVESEGELRAALNGW